MTKLRFLAALEDRLSGLPKEEVQERLRFYSEMIDDRMEEGIPEEEAVAAVGKVDEIAEQVVADVPLVKLVGEKVKPHRKLKTWEIVLLAVGSPLWASLLLAAASVVISLYAALWSIIAALWTVFGSMIACALAGVGAGIYKDAESAVKGAVSVKKIYEPDAAVYDEYKKCYENF